MDRPVGHSFVDRKAGTGDVAAPAQDRPEWERRSWEAVGCKDWT